MDGGQFEIRIRTFGRDLQLSTINKNNRKWQLTRTIWSGWKSIVHRL